ncbi:hypothetical protein Agabi119p4_6907 [Agaricus bisporus var. burnettii]|uniref:Uncharacterized protein n=1 Tax=Agaricus bisporus var. burnettii TaxID=192524 RepID=A0A8H7C796_AGABI|nr:hypothetical protein Agabi119p4_8512 [Agaricus bisporus var. burnettii]KAF7770933.1 hypothetical protein Agabi119p4_6907 [Agaricus bisporus var. burnettii]
MAKRTAKTSQAAPKKPPTKPKPRATGAAKVQRATRAATAAASTTVVSMADTPTEVSTMATPAVDTTIDSTMATPVVDTTMDSTMATPAVDLVADLVVDSTVAASTSSTSSLHVTPASDLQSIPPSTSPATFSISSSSVPKSSSTPTSTSSKDDINALKAIIAQQKAELDKREKADVFKSSQTVKIPKPVPLGKLVEAMQLEDDKLLYNNCRAAVKTVCAEARIPVGTSWHKQDPNVLSKAAKHAKALQPHLGIYENDWAIFEIMKGSNKNKRGYSARTSQGLKARQKGTSGPEVGVDDEIDEVGDGEDENTVGSKRPTMTQGMQSQKRARTR